MSAALLRSLRDLRDALAATPLALEAPEAAAARRVRDELMGQIEDYLVPRLERMEAPLLMVVGGSTGAGKSTLVNSLVGEEVSTAGVLRPTTRDPVLAFHPADEPWFADDRILPALARSTGTRGATGGLHLEPTDRLPRGLALLDAPDVDSVVEANRLLARQLLAAADAWLFVTTAARYADAVPWELLHAARERGTAISLVLNRVPRGAQDEVAGHLAEMLAERGLGGTELLVVAEVETLEDGLVPAADLGPVRAWLDGLAADATARGALVQRTLVGALDSLPPRVATVAAAAEEQAATAQALRGDVTSAYGRALEEVDEALRSGALLRGEVLARWHDVVGTGDLMRALESGVGRLRDRVRTLLTGRAAPTEQLQTAVQSSVDALLHTAADRAAERSADAWRARPAGRVLLEPGGRLDTVSPGFPESARAVVRAWQEHVFELVSAEGADKRTTARLASLGVNGAGLVVMLGVFGATGGLTGAEVVVAGGTSAIGQKVLEAIFGDQAVRTLAQRAREDLLVRVERLLGAESARFTERLVAAPEPLAADARTLRSAMAAVTSAR